MIRNVILIFIAFIVCANEHYAILQPKVIDELVLPFDITLDSQYISNMPMKMLLFDNQQLDKTIKDIELELLLKTEELQVDELQIKHEKVSVIDALLNAKIECDNKNELFEQGLLTEREKQMCISNINKLSVMASLQEAKIKHHEIKNKQQNQQIKLLEDSLKTLRVIKGGLTKKDAFILLNEVKAIFVKGEKIGNWISSKEYYGQMWMLPSAVNELSKKNVQVELEGKWYDAEMIINPIPTLKGQTMRHEVLLGFTSDISDINRLYGTKLNIRYA